jgi:nucleotide-binding universal stress UspA family protein
MFHRILVGVDDSKAARRALAWAVELVEAGHGRLGLLSCAPPAPPVAAAGPVVLPISRERLQEDLLKWAERNVEEAARQVPAEIPITKLVAQGRPGAALLKEARTGCWDLVVVGESRRRHRLLRSVGQWLGRRIGIPVLVVHEDESEPHRGRRAGLLPQPRRDRRRQPKIA